MGHLKRLTVVGLAASVLAGSLTIVPMTASPAAGYCVYSSGSRWASGWGIQVFAANAIPSGFRGAVRNATNGWNGIPNAAWSTAYIDRDPTGPIAHGGQVIWNNTSIDYQGAPGITRISRNSAGYNILIGTYLNPAYSWNADGVMNQSQMKADIDTVTRHELGHWLTILHPSACGLPMTQLEIDAVMNPNWRTKWAINQDDRDAAVYLY